MLQRKDSALGLYFISYRNFKINVIVIDVRFEADTTQKLFDDFSLNIRKCWCVKTLPCGQKSERTEIVQKQLPQTFKIIASN